MVGNLSPVVIALIFLLINMVTLYLILLVQPPSKDKAVKPHRTNASRVIRVVLSGIVRNS